MTTVNTRVFSVGRWSGFGLVIAIMLLTAAPAMAQATSTFNGRVLDQGDAVLPGVTVTVTNQNTGVVRTTVTNERRACTSCPASSPASTASARSCPDSSPRHAGHVTLAVNATITVDFKLALAGVDRGGDGHRGGAADRGDAVEGRLEHRGDGAAEPADDHAQRQRHAGAAAGRRADRAGAPQQDERRQRVVRRAPRARNVIPTVDGADNRDNQYGGPLMTLLDRSLEQFQLATSQFTAADGRTGGAALTMVTKSGTNAFHGSAFAFARDDALTAKDYFTERSEPGEDAVQPPAVRRIDRRPDPAQPGVLLRRRRTDARGLGASRSARALFNEKQLLVEATGGRASCRRGSSTRTTRASVAQPRAAQLYHRQGRTCS